MKIRNIKKKKHIIITFGLVIVVGTGLFSVLRNDNQSKTSNQNPEISQQETAVQGAVISDKVEAPEVQEETTPAVVEERPTPPPVAEPAPTWPVQYTQSEATSITIVVNKKHQLPSDYAPAIVSGSGAQLRAEASGALTNLLTAAQSAGKTMKVISSYRSYSTQVSTYNKWVSQSGQAAADTFSARPGHSEHQLGLAADLGNGTCDLEICFGDTEAGKWLASNSQNYGFIIRYPSGKDSITGYQYEPWHIRYVGVDTAKAIVASGKTMDEYYGVTAGDYQ